MVSTISSGSCACGSKRNIRSAVLGIDAAVDADREPVRDIELAEEHREALAFRRLRVEAEQAAALGTQPPVSATTNRVRVSACPPSSGHQSQFGLSVSYGSSRPNTHKSQSFMIAKVLRALKPAAIAVLSTVLVAAAALSAGYLTAAAAQEREGFFNQFFGGNERGQPP